MKPEKGGMKNICDARICEYRRALLRNTTQKPLAEQITALGLKMIERTIHNIENGNWYIYDMELVYLVKVLNFI